MPDALLDGSKMDAEREQFLLDEIAKRDAIIERQAAEILVLRQAIDALTRRVFGVSSEKLDSAQLELLLDPEAAKKAAAAAPADPGPAAEIKDHKKRAPKTRAPRIPEHLPVRREVVDPPEVLLEPNAYRRFARCTHGAVGNCNFPRICFVSPMREPKPSTIKRLFAYSRNKCAFPQCDLPIVEETGTVTGIVCHIKARNRGGPRHDAKQSDEERHAFDNLHLLCSRHSKVIDSEPRKFTVELLKELKEIHEKDGNIEISRVDSMKAEKLLEDYRIIYVESGGQVHVRKADTIHAKTVNIGKTKGPTIGPPEGAIASSLSHRNYVKYLIDRYQEFASDQSGRVFKYPAIYSNLKKGFGAKWDLVSLGRFNDLTAYLQGRIDRTRLGRINS